MTTIHAGLDIAKLNLQLHLAGRVHDLPNTAAGPGFATALGLVAWAAGDGRSPMDLDLDNERPDGMLRRVVNFLRERM